MRSVRLIFSFNRNSHAQKLQIILVVLLVVIIVCCFCVSCRLGSLEHLLTRVWFSHIAIPSCLCCLWKVVLDAYVVEHGLL